MAEIVKRKLTTRSAPLGPSEPESNHTVPSANDIGMDDIDRKVPPKIMRLTQHLHNLIYIRFFYEQIGQQPPDWIKHEMVRAQNHLTDELDTEQGQGGLFYGGKHETR